MTEEQKMWRRERDRARYMEQREERLVRQRAYYRAHREACKASVKRSRQRRVARELLMLAGSEEHGKGERTWE